MSQKVSVACRMAIAREIPEDITFYPLLHLSIIIST